MKKLFITLGKRKGGHEMTNTKIVKIENKWVLIGTRDDGTCFNYRYGTKAEAKKAAAQIGVKL